MPSFKIEDAAFAGVGLLIRHPAAALVWAVLWTAVIALVTVPFAAGLADLISTVARSGTQLDPTTAANLFAGLIAFFLLAGLFSLALGSVVSCAVYRAIFNPEESAYAFLRLGDQELHVLLVNFVKGAILSVASSVLGGMLGLFGLFARAVGGEMAERSVYDIGYIIVLAVQIWLWLRFAFAGPMTFLDHRFRLFESWAMSRGMVLRLLAVGAIILLIVIVVYFALAVTGIMIGGAMWSGSLRTSDLQALLAQSPTLWMTALGPFILLSAFLVTIGATILSPIVNAPWAQAWRTLILSVDPNASFSRPKAGR
jgi:hypothetical protein